MQKKVFSKTVDLKIQDKLKEGLIEQGFELSQAPYTLFCAKKKGVSCSLYESGKLVVQGKDSPEFIEFYLEPNILGSFEFGYEQEVIDPSPRIGIDEAGKGDFFGPLCVAALYSDKIPDLLKLGVSDSKKISDQKCIKIARELKKTCTYHVVRIGPAKYNQLYESFQNLNYLLAWGHASALNEVYQKSECTNVIADKFAATHVLQRAVEKKGLSLNLEQKVRAEADPVVAAASILARAAFLEGLEELGKIYDTTLPKGASKMVIEAGRKLVIKHGKEILQNLAKIHFKTTQDVLC